MHHNLKAHPDSFELISQRISQVQLRKNDRSFRVGDTIAFFEYLPERGFYSGRKTGSIEVEIVLENHEGLTTGWCVIVLKVPTANIATFDAKLAGKPSITVESA